MQVHALNPRPPLVGTVLAHVQYAGASRPASRTLNGLVVMTCQAEVVGSNPDLADLLVCEQAVFGFLRF